MLWKSSLWKALWGHCHRRLKAKIKFTIFRQLQPYGTFQGLLLPFYYVLSTFVQNLRFYRYLHSRLQYDIISQPRNGKLSELTWRVKLSEFAMLSEAWTLHYFTLGTMVSLLHSWTHFSQCNERTHQLSAFPGNFLRKLHVFLSTSQSLVAFAVLPMQTHQHLWTLKFLFAWSAQPMRL